MSVDLMSNFMGAYSVSTENGDRHALHGERHEEPGSQSGSDEGGNAQYADSLRNEADFDDDCEALTSQTLNADGTPKRPMNAFMIFARRRRPQVSAENQAMRTGEISKVLSKEWAVMLPSEKQFYLDRAKQLKETFNNKYPDYVYRRRPNNSRKKSKRRLDASTVGPIDNGSTPEAGEEFGGAVGDYEVHPEADDRHYDGCAGTLHGRLHHDYMGSTQARSNAYSPYMTSETGFRHEGSHDPRMSFLTQQGERLTCDVSATSHRLPHSEMYGYVPAPSQAQSAHIYSADPGDTHDRWESRVNAGRAGWIGAHERSVPTSTQRYAPNTAATWSGGVASSPAAPASNGTSAGNFTFPTLTSPFYPSQTHLQSYQATTTSSHPNSPVRYDSPSNHGQQGPPGRDYDTQNYNSSSSVGSENQYRDGATMYQHRLANISRGLPSIQNLADYSHSPHLASTGSGATQGY
ncbi:hypothetical protein AX15_003406 [Amanita polypyramis BW_CC]|nr:hypothetical protein AX15_003406 [Amanita polypyramis BW_CC]